MIVYPAGKRHSSLGSGYTQIDTFIPLQMATKLQLKSALKETQSEVICSKCSRGSTVKKVSFDLKPVYTKLEALERFNRRMITIQQLIEGRHVSTSKLILLLIEIRFTVRALKKKCKKTNYYMVL